MTPRTPAAPSPGAPGIEVRDLSIRYRQVVALRPTSLRVCASTIHAIIGPAGSGKTSLLRALNRMAQDVDRAHVEGQVLIAGADVLAPGADATCLRRRVGMVFAQPEVLPGTVFDNAGFGLRLAGLRGRAEIEERVEEGLRDAQLWDEVKDRLRAPAHRLSLGQQQRLCLARSLAVRPEVLLLDEPCSALDPISTLRVEEALRSLKRRMTIVLVTNHTKQAARLGDRVAFLLLGELVEDATAEELFTSPRDGRTNDYLSGRFG